MIVSYELSIAGVMSSNSIRQIQNQHVSTGDRYHVFVIT